MSIYNLIEDDIYLINEPSFYNNGYNDDLKIDRQDSSEDADKPASDIPKKDIIIQNDSVAINISNIEEEQQLNVYMDNHFTNRLNSDLEKINNMNYINITKDVSKNTFYPIYKNKDEMSFFEQEFIQNNSPISMSPRSSDISVSDAEEQSVKHFEIIKSHSDIGSGYPSTNQLNKSSKKVQFKRLTYADVEQSLDKYYNLDNNKFSNEFDIMITYLKGQKNIYIQSKNITNIKLNILFIPSLFLTAGITIFAPVMNNYAWASIFISAANALLTLTISLINYLKLQSSTDMYFNLANQYDKLETSIEITSNKLFFLKKDIDQNELVLQKIKYIESKLTEIKDTNPILVPEIIKIIFPVISHINIFSLIKKIETYKKKLIIKFRDIKNEIGYIVFKWKNKHINIFDEMPNPSHDFIREQKRLFFLLKIKDNIKNELIQYKNAYVYVDDIISKEIRKAESYKTWWRAFFYRKHNKLYGKYTNPVIQSILNIIFLED